VDLLNDQKIDLVITDLKMPKHSGLDLVRYLSENFDDIGIIMITGYGDIQSAVESIKQGARDYVTKPFKLDEILGLVKQTIREKTSFISYLPFLIQK